MGVNFSAIFEHSLNFQDIHKLANELELGTLFPITKRFHEHPSTSNNCWKLTRDRIIESSIHDQFDNTFIGKDEYVELEGPNGYKFLFNKDMCEFTTGRRWHWFIKDINEQQNIRKIIWDCLVTLNLTYVFTQVMIFA